MKSKLNPKDKERLLEIRDEMFELMEEVKDILRGDHNSIYERARVYWVGHILSALGSDEYCTKYETTMVDTLVELGFNRETEFFDHEEENEEDEE